jgi:hypothetical protein
MAYRDWATTVWDTSRFANQTERFRCVTTRLPRYARPFDIPAKLSLLRGHVERTSTLRAPRSPRSSRRRAADTQHVLPAAILAIRRLPGGQRRGHTSDAHSRVCTRRQRNHGRANHGSSPSSSVRLAAPSPGCDSWPHLQIYRDALKSPREAAKYPASQRTEPGERRRPAIDWLCSLAIAYVRVSDLRARCSQSVHAVARERGDCQTIQVIQLL